MKWRDAVLKSLHAYSLRHQTRAVERQLFLKEELASIAAATGTAGLTPEQTLSRHLQQLRDEGLVEFLGNGSYLLLDSPFDAEAEDLTDEALDYAIRAGRLKLGRVETDVRPALVRRRKGQDRLRSLTLEGYASRCAVCDVADLGLLIASHIVRWADAPEHRGELENVLSLCRFHDALFELGYWSLTDDLQVVKRGSQNSRMVAAVLDAAQTFRAPHSFPPNPEYVRRHRTRSGLPE